MAKLYFRYGAMGSSKTANALMVRYNYIERGQNPILLKPRTDTRDGETIVKSRMGLEAECMFVDDFLHEVSSKWIDGDESEHEHYDCIIVDECQFLLPSEVEMLAMIVDRFSIPVICYGLMSDFTSHLFEGSKRLVELADKIEEVSTVCWCGKKAHFNARVSNGRLVQEGEQIMMGGNESYVSLCRKHYSMGLIQAPEGYEK